MSVYDDVGGEAGVRKLVDDFYDFMDQLPEAAEVRALHPASLDESRTKFFWFMSGWLGGPPLYMERKGHPRLRARHMPFPVDDRMRDQWMLCMRKALALTALNNETREKLDTALFQLADHMRNKQS